MKSFLSIFILLIGFTFMTSCEQESSEQPPDSLDLTTKTNVVDYTSEQLSTFNFKKHQDFTLVDFSEQVDLSDYEIVFQNKDLTVRSISGIIYYEQGGSQYMSVDDLGSYSSSRIGDCSSCPCGYSTIVLACPGGLGNCTYCRCCDCPIE